MRKLSGTLLALAGVSAGTYALWSGQNTVALPPKISADPSVRAPTSAPQTRAEADPAAAAALPPSATTAPIPSKVLNVADAAPRVAYPPSSGLPLDRARLTREIQFQLKRVGCYHGTIDGVWSATVRLSMKAFTDRVNATLSAEQPDIVLLAMLQSHRGSGCGVPCPPGQSLAVDGRCLPNGLIAKRTEKQAPAGSIPTASPSIGEQLPAGQPQSKEERMSLAGLPLPPATFAGQLATDAPAKAGRRRATPPVGTASGQFPRWAVHAFESR